jgi:hypothetical protein
MPGRVARTRQEQTRPARRRAACLPSTSLRAADAKIKCHSGPVLYRTRLRTGLFIEEPLAAGPRDAGLRTRHLAAVQARDKREAHAAAIRVSIPHGCERELRAWEDCRCSSLAIASATLRQTAAIGAKRSCGEWPWPARCGPPASEAGREEPAASSRAGIPRVRVVGSIARRASVARRVWAAWARVRRAARGSGAGGRVVRADVSGRAWRGRV